MDKIILNGKLIKESQATISILDKGYFFDFSVYTSIKVIRGKIFFPEYHIDRLFKSAQIIELEHQFSKSDVLKWLNLLVQKNKINDVLLRVILIGDPDCNKDAKLFIFPVTGLTYYSDEMYKKGVKVITYHGERKIPTAKAKDMLLIFLAYREAKRRGAVDALLVDKDGNIREGTQSNFFAMKDNTIIVPPKEKVLEGITKKIVLQVTKDKFEVKERDISLSDIKNYDEFFITSTTKNVMPINQIDDIKIDSNFKRIKVVQKLFKDYYRKHVLNQ